MVGIVSHDLRTPLGAIDLGVQRIALSLALGARPNTPIGLGGHPFDVELTRLAPSAGAPAPEKVIAGGQETAGASSVPRTAEQSQGEASTPPQENFHAQVPSAFLMQLGIPAELSSH